MDGLDNLFRKEIIEELEEDTIFDDDKYLVEACMSHSELNMLEEAELDPIADEDLEDFDSDFEDNDLIDDMIDMEDEIHG